MNKKLIFVLFAVLMMAVMTVSVSADQDGLDRYCNSDQYGCWVTGDDGAQIYIMFWSESARDLFMGPGSKAVVTEPYPAGRMSLGKSSGKSSSTKSSTNEISMEKIQELAEYYGRSVDYYSYDTYLYYVPEGNPEDYVDQFNRMYNEMVSEKAEQ